MCHLYYWTLTSDQSGPELTWHFWTIRPADFRSGRYRYSVKLIPAFFFRFRDWVVGPRDICTVHVGWTAGFRGETAVEDREFRDEPRGWRPRDSWMEPRSSTASSNEEHAVPNRGFRADRRGWEPRLPARQPRLETAAGSPKAAVLGRAIRASGRGKNTLLYLT